MAGLMVVKDFFNWPEEEAIDRYNADLTIQYAMNIDQGSEISRATYFRCQKMFREDERGRAAINVSEQRLDSTHVCGDIEALNGNLKQNTSLRRLRCRGGSAVHTAIYTIAAMHNIMRFAAYCRKTGKKFSETAFSAFLRLLAGCFHAFNRLLTPFFRVSDIFSALKILWPFFKLSPTGSI